MEWAEGGILAGGKQCWRAWCALVEIMQNELLEMWEAADWDIPRRGVATGESCSMDVIFPHQERNGACCTQTVKASALGSMGTGSAVYWLGRLGPSSLIALRLGFLICKDNNMLCTSQGHCQ